MTNRERLERAIEQRPEARRSIVGRPDWSRREFFRIAGAGVTASFLTARARATEAAWQAPVTPNGKAKNAIFVLLAGAPSHTDTFDLKVAPGTTPDAVQPETKNGLLWPMGILPGLGEMLGDIAIVRSMRSWALVHSLAQTWTQIGRNPAAALGDIAPNIGSVVALETALDRSPGKIFPAFLALNSNGAAGPGYFDSRYAPFKTAPNANGLANTANPDREARFTAKWDLMHALDQPLRAESPYGKTVEAMNDFYDAARGLMYNPSVDSAFRFTAEDSQRYGSTSFGNACLIAKQALAANQGTRFVQITLGGWDMHQNIYGAGGDPTRGTNIFTLGKTFDAGLSALLADLKSTGLLDETLVVAVGEFGRTVGKLSGAAGRDHFAQQSALFAGAGVKGGRAIGSTDATGSATEEPGWARERDVKPEDIEATIYSAMGINWTTIRYDDPFGRGFEYVPFAKDDVYGPVNELWA